MFSARQPTGSILTPRRLLLLVCVGVVAPTAAAENLFVRPEDRAGGANSGADWENAWRGFDSIIWGAGPGALGAGDTCWIAGGVYRKPLVIRANGGPEHLLVLRRARVMDATAAGAAGWREDFDSSVVIRAPGSCILFPDGTGSHVVLDGRVLSGIRVDYENGGTGVEIDGRTDVTNLTLRFIEAAGPGPVVQIADTRGFDLTPVALLVDVTLSHCTAHHSDTLLQVGPSVDLLVEYCDFHHASSLNPALFHPNVIYLATALRPTLRFNLLHDFDVEGIFFGDPGNVGAQIHGNVFYQGAAPPDSGRGLEFDDGADSTDFRIHHNTFVNLPLPALNFRNGRPHPGASVRNNLFVGCSTEFGPAEHDFNFFTIPGIAEPHGLTGPVPLFVDAARFDYHLAGPPAADSPRDHGFVLGAPFDRDGDENLRGADSAPDIGAFEFDPALLPLRALPDQGVTAGHAISFSAPSGLRGLQWQISRDSGASFADLTDGPGITGTNSRTLTLNQVTAAQNGERYRYVYLVRLVSTPSPAARLTVSPEFFPRPTAIVRDPTGNLFVADSTSNTVRKIDPLGRVTLLAGREGEAGATDGSGLAARFNQPSGLALLAGGALAVADSANATLRRISPAGEVTTLAGSPTRRGENDGPALAASFQQPVGLAPLATGGLAATDAANHTLRVLLPDGTVRTIAGVSRLPGAADGPATEARFNFPTGLAATAAGDLIIVDSANNTLRRLDPSGAVTTYAGLANVAGFADGPGSLALFNRPTGLAADAAGNLYVTDAGNSLVRRLTAGGVVSTVAGLPGVAGHQDGTGSDALFHQPLALASDPEGNLYVADTGNAAIRRITPAGTVTTLALTAGPEPVTPPSPPDPATPPAPGTTPAPAQGSAPSWPALAAAGAVLALRAYIRGATIAQPRPQN